MAAKRVGVVPDDGVSPYDGVSERALAVGVLITLLMAGAAGVIHYSASDPGERTVTGPWGSIAFTVVIAGPAFVAMIGSLSRPWVLGAAGVAQVPMLLLSFSPLFVPLLAPAAIFIAQGSSMRRGPHRSRWQPPAAVVAAVLLLMAPLCLLVHQDPVSWSTATGSGSASDVVTATEALVACLCVVGALVAAVAAPPDRVRSGSSG